MRLSFLTRRHVVAGGVAVLALFAVLLVMLPTPVVEPAKSADKLALTWAENGDLQVEGAGYRPKGLADVRLGSAEIEQVRADELGRVRVSVPERAIAAGQPGASVSVIGRSKYGLARTLISAVPPKAAGWGPVDALPWAVGVTALAAVGLGAARRQRGVKSVAIGDRVSG